MLCAQPHRNHWCTQKDVERGLGLEERDISTFFQALGRGRHSKMRRKKVATHLAAAGVYRVLGSKYPTNEWWIAFTGKGGAEPRFHSRGEDNSFIVEKDKAGEEFVAEPGTAGTAGDKGGGASGILREEGESAAGTAGEASGIGTDDDSPKLRQRAAWVRSDAMQMMMSQSTNGHFLNLGELSRFLDVPANGLREVLQPDVKGTIGDHDMFLKTFGISKEQHFRKPCWSLFGRGHLFTLGSAECASLPSARLQPTFWTGEQRRAYGAPENAPPGLQARDVLDISNLTKDINRSLQCRNCEPNNPRNAPRHGWEFMRVMSPGTSILSPEAPGELGVKFECANCESIHISVPLPAKGLVPEGRRWSTVDRAVQFVFGSVHAWSN